MNQNQNKNKSRNKRRNKRGKQTVGLDVRGVVADVLADVLRDGVSLSSLFPRRLTDLEPGQRALVQEISYGVLRWYPRLEALAGRLLSKPLRAKDSDVYALVLAGLYQLIYMRLPEHAAVSETVAAVEGLNKSWARGLVNAVLREFLRQRETLEQEVDKDDVARLACPRWLLERVRADWPDDWQTVLEAATGRGPMTLRVNSLHQSRDEYLQRLLDVELTAKRFEADVFGLDAADGLVLTAPVDVQLLPGFDAGDVSVQDGGAQLLADVLQVQPGQRVLDACAAPGGKACHLLERYPQMAELFALDRDSDRLERVEENFERLDLSAAVICGDAARPDDWWDGELFDHIVVDAPCSATGVIRRHPDIKVLRKADDIAQLVLTQEKIIDALWPLLKPGGLMIYVTCSILAAENSEQVAAFLGRHDDARAESLDVAWGRPAGVGRQILPGEQDMDGFYYARIRRLEIENLESEY